MTPHPSRIFRILVVDDESIVLSFVSDALADEDLEITTCSESKAALELARSTEFDLILSDMRMPGMDGTELVRRVREITPDIAVIYMTGYANLNSAKEAIKQGAVDYVMKPFELTEIRQAIRKAVERKLDDEEKSSTRQLKTISELSNMLFEASDGKGLILSSLKFAMMHHHCRCGSVLLQDAESDEFHLVSIVNEASQQASLSDEKLVSYLMDIDAGSLREPVIVNNLEEHPIYRGKPEPGLISYLYPEWMSDQVTMIAAPIVRADRFYGMLMLGFPRDAVKPGGTTLQILAITATQMAVTLENLSLLSQTRQAYARLKELQDETIKLETMAARGQTAAEIGHELNNFLGVIAGSIALLDNHLKNKRYELLDRYVIMINETVEKIKAFTTNLMDLRPVSYEKEIIDFSALLREVIEYLGPQRRFQDVTIKVIGIPENLLFEANPTQVQQLLHNLFNNAADATNVKGNGQIDVSVSILAEQEKFVFKLTDNGVGIEPSRLEKAFNERFTTKETGHGFGLMVCKRIIENHGGELSVDSTVGEGTSVVIRFPLVNKTALEPAETLG